MLTAGAHAVRATIAAHMLGRSASRRLGEITLHAHQREAVGRLRRMMGEHRGALLADDVGLGKTFTALAVAMGAANPMVIAPAAVRDHWLACARLARMSIVFHSAESLSRHGPPTMEPDLVIIDEAHHFRSRNTLRFAAAVRLCARTRVLLLSATPVQNRATDLRVMLSIFLGVKADSLRESELARYVLRRTAADLGAANVRLPIVEAPEWLPCVDDSDCLDRILALPPAVPPLDGADGGVLVTYTLVRQWASSRGALLAGLRRRHARGLAMIDVLSAGRVPTREELALWCHVENSQQLSFPHLFVADRAERARALLAQVEQHVAALRALIDALTTTADPDVERAGQLVALMRRRSSERIIAFSEYADTVTCLFRLLAPTVRTAMLTHDGGRLVSGAVSRAEILARFAAGAARRAHIRERIDLLLTTDVLSEGVNLPDASVVVHVDLAWNPARLAQRVGRLRRVDSVHGSIGVYLMPPPASAERMLQLEHRLRAKRAIATRTIGVEGSILPGPEGAAVVSTPVEIGERLASILRGWREASDPCDAPACAAVRSPMSGAVACLRLDGQVRMRGIAGSRVTSDDETMERLCAAANGENVPIDERAALRARAALERHLASHDVSGMLDLPTMHVARSRRIVLRRLDTISRRTSRESRPRLAPLMRAARTATTLPLSAGAEDVLDELARAPMADDAWLQAVNEFAAVHMRREPGDRPEILALLILQPR